MKEFNKSIKLEHVAYDIRGPVLEEAMRCEQMEKNRKSPSTIPQKNLA